MGAVWPVKVPGLSEPGQANQDGEQQQRQQETAGHSLTRFRCVADRKEKSLGRLSQKFIQLFLVGVSRLAHLQVPSDCHS